MHLHETRKVSFVGVEKRMVERAKADLGRWVLGVNDRASKRGVLYELGWDTVWGGVVRQNWVLWEDWVV